MFFLHVNFSSVKQKNNKEINEFAGLLLLMWPVEELRVPRPDGERKGPTIIIAQRVAVSVAHSSWH